MTCYPKVANMDMPLDQWVESLPAGDRIDILEADPTGGPVQRHLYSKATDTIMFLGEKQQDVRKFINPEDLPDNKNVLYEQARMMRVKKKKITEQDMDEMEKAGELFAQAMRKVMWPILDRQWTEDIIKLNERFRLKAWKGKNNETHWWPEKGLVQKDGTTSYRTANSQELFDAIGRHIVMLNGRHKRTMEELTKALDTVGIYRDQLKATLDEVGRREDARRVVEQRRVEREQNPVEDERNHATGQASLLTGICTVDLMQCEHRTSEGCTSPKHFCQQRKPQFKNGGKEDPAKLRCFLLTGHMTCGCWQDNGLCGYDGQCNNQGMATKEHQDTQRDKITQTQRCTCAEGMGGRPVCEHYKGNRACTSTGHCQHQEPGTMPDTRPEAELAHYMSGLGYRATGKSCPLCIRREAHNYNDCDAYTWHDPNGPGQSDLTPVRTRGNTRHIPDTQDTLETGTRKESSTPPTTGDNQNSNESTKPLEQAGYCVGCNRFTAHHPCKCKHVEHHTNQ